MAHGGSGCLQATPHTLKVFWKVQLAVLIAKRLRGHWFREK